MNEREFERLLETLTGIEARLEDVACYLSEMKDAQNFRLKQLVDILIYDATCLVGVEAALYSRLSEEQRSDGARFIQDAVKELKEHMKEGSESEEDGHEGKEEDVSTG